MTTLWWVVVVWLTAAVCFAAGFVLRHEFELYGRARRGEMLDFTRRRIGA